LIKINDDEVIYSKEAIFRLDEINGRFDK